MTKRLMATVLAFAMIIGMIVVPANAAETETQTQVGYCQHCKTVIPEAQWQPWDLTQTTPQTGHYYLTGDISNQEKQINIGVDTELERRQVCLDLRGRSYTVIGLRPFGLRGIFSIMDSVGGGMISTTGASNAHGGLIQCHKGNVTELASEFNLYSGTVRKINSDTDLVSYGGLVYLSSGATFNMYGGKLIGGEVVAHRIGNANYGGLGGTIYAKSANVNLYGGVVTGGVSTTTRLPKIVSGVASETETVNFEGTAGNIYAEDGSNVLIDGATVKDGYADVYAGNIYITNSNLTIASGTVSGGVTQGASGNIQVGNTSGKTASFTMTGGTLTGGTCRTRGGNLFVNNNGVNIDISGGTIDGDLSVGVFKSFKLSGAPKINMGLSNGLRLQSVNGTKMDISGLTEGAVIYLDGVDQVFTGVLENPDTYLTYFKDAIRADITVDGTGALRVDQGKTGFCPHCWETGKQVTWTAFNNATPSTSVEISAAGTAFPLDENGQHHAYLTGTTSRTRLLTITADAELVLDMASFTLTVTNYKFANLYGKLSLLDSMGGGAVTGTGHANANGGVIMGGTDMKEFNMYSGTLSRTVKSGEASKRIFAGGVLYAPYGDVNIYGGIIKGGIASIPLRETNSVGGNIYVTGEFTMTGGALVGGTAVTTTQYAPTSTAATVDSEKILISYGGNLCVSGNATISGGQIIGGNAGYGGNICVTSTGTLTMTGGAIRDGVCGSDVNTKDYGGNLYVAGNSEISNSLIRGGSTEERGGNLYVAGATLTLRDSVVAEGYAGINKVSGVGGNLYLSTEAGLELYNSIVGNGYAKNAGGNLYGVQTDVQINMYSGYIIGGEAEGAGGNLCGNGLTMTGGVITGGSGNGGNISISGGAGNFLTIRDDDDNTTPIPRVTNGISSDRGGNINMGNGTTLTLGKCLIEGGTAVGLGGNIYLGLNCSAEMDGTVIRNGDGDTGNAVNNFDGDNIYSNEGTSLTMKDTTVSGITSATSTYGNGVCTMSALILQGNTNIINEERDACIYIGSKGSLTVDKSFAGTASVAFENSHFADVNVPYGTALVEKNKNTGVFTGKLFLEGYSGRDYGLPGIYVVENDNKLYVASTAVVDAQGEETWYANNADAIAACGEGEYVKLCTTEDVVLTKDCTIDINGKNVQVSGNYILQAIDSAGDDLAGNVGTVTLVGKVGTTDSYLTADGAFYVNLKDETNNTLTSHRMDMDIKMISIRPKNVGLYFTGNWSCDETLKGQIETFGMALSCNDAPGDDFATDGDTLYTSFPAEKLAETTGLTSVIVANILTSDKTPEQNTARAKEDIYVAPYIVLKDGTPLVTGVEEAFNLHDTMHKVDKVEGNLYLDNKVALEKFYSTWSDTMSTWGFDYIGNTDPTDDNVLNVLLIGNSFCYYFTDELYAMLQEQYPDKEVNVVNAYKSGCLMREHYAWLLDSTNTRYQFITENKDGRKTLYNMSLKEGLMLRDWDVISLQQHYQPKVAMDYDTAWATIDPYDDTLYGFLKSHFPKAELFWQQTWAYQVGYEKPLSAEADSVEPDNKVLTVDKQTLNHGVIRQTALTVCQENGVTRAPLGDAWALVRADGYDNLCARTGVDNGVGDFYHDGDIGGGQYLNACVWFEMITGEDCTSLTYRPSYSLTNADQITFEDLAEAAHQAVANLSAEA